MGGCDAGVVVAAVEAAGVVDAVTVAGVIAAPVTTIGTGLVCSAGSSCTSWLPDGSGIGVRLLCRLGDFLRSLFSFSRPLAFLSSSRPLSFSRPFAFFSSSRSFALFSSPSLLPRFSPRIMMSGFARTA